MIKKIWMYWATACGVLVLLILFDWPTTGFSKMAVLNEFGPSTLYQRPFIATATKDKDGNAVVYLGDNFFVMVSITRFERNGTCTFAVKRYAEFVGGPHDGHRFLISTAVLHFRGENDTANVPWPVDTNPWHVGTAIEAELPTEPYFVPYPYRWNPNIQQHELVPPFNEKAREGFVFIPEGQDEQRFTFYVVGRYFCNRLDYWFERYIQGGDRENITQRVDAIVKRHRP